MQSSHRPFDPPSRDVRDGMPSCPVCRAIVPEHATRCPTCGETLPSGFSFSANRRIWLRIGYAILPVLIVGALKATFLSDVLTPRRRHAPPAVAMPDLDARELRTRLERLGLACSSPIPDSPPTSWRCRQSDPSRGHLTVTVLGAGPVEMVIALLQQRQADDAAAAVRLAEVAGCVLAGGDAEASRAWIRANIATGGGTVIGQTELHLSGVPRSRVADLKAVGSRYH